MSIIGAMLGVIHPDQYAAGMGILETLQANPSILWEPEHMRTVLDLWCIPFSGCAIIANRETPEHRDTQGRGEWYDILSTLGDYEGATLDFPGLGVSFGYESGTMVGLCGKVLSHKVGRVEEGDQVCFAWFMREKVAKHLHWPNVRPSCSESVEAVQNL